MLRSGSSDFLSNLVEDKTHTFLHFNLSLNPSVYLNVDSTFKNVACHLGLWS